MSTMPPLRPHATQRRLWTTDKRFVVVPCGRRCLEQGTLVATPTGPVAIEALRVGDVVIGYNEYGNLEETKVANVWDNGKQYVYPLLSNGKKFVAATANHKFLAAYEQGDNHFRKIPVSILSKQYQIKNTNGSVIRLEKDKPYLVNTFDITVDNSTNLYMLHHGGLITANSGKTEFAKRFTLLKALKGSSFPNARYFLAAPTRAQAKDIYWADLKKYSPLSLVSDKSETELFMEYVNGSRIYVRGMDKPERIEGTPWDGGVLDEFANMKSKAWLENVRPALADRRGWCWLIGVPEGRNHYYDIYKDALADETGEWGVYSWISADILDPDEIAQIKLKYDELTYRQEYEGCHLPGTKVRMWNGSEKEIVDISPGDILTSFQNGKITKTTVLKSEWTGKKEMLKVMTEDSQEFIASKYHKMRVDGKVVTLNDCGYVDVVNENRVHKLKIVSKQVIGIQNCRNITVDSPDSSYILANGFDNYNSFVNFAGSAYYNFSDKTHYTKVGYNPNIPLHLCFDFNISPGIAVAVQEVPQQEVHNITVPDATPNVSVAVGEVHIPRNSNTEIVSNRLVNDYANHKSSIFVYGDATGGAGGTTKLLGSDWDIVQRILKSKFGNAVQMRVPRSNPRERIRVNSVNSRLKSVSGFRGLMVNAHKCPNLVKDFEGVQTVEGGSGEIDKKKTPELTHLCFGKGTIIDTEKGKFKIVELPPSGKIKTYDGTYVNYTDFGSRGEKDTIKLIFSEGSPIICTKDHLFLTAVGWVKAIDLFGIAL